MPIRSRRRSPPALVAALAAFVLPAAPAPAWEGARVEAFWVEASAPPSERAARAVPGLLSTPPGWMTGDAAVVVLSDGPWPGSARERLVHALLEEGAAVLELDVDAARGFSPESAHAEPPPPAAELVPDLRGAVDALQRDTAAGLVVAAGRGAGGEAAVLAAAAARAEPGNGLAAGASLGPGPAAFALGCVPFEGGMGVHRGWPVRARRLCGVLAAVVVPPDAEAEAECRRALVAPGENRPVRVAGPP